MLWSILACGGGGGAESSDAIESTIADDAVELARVVTDLATGAASVPDDGERATAQQCYPTWDPCQLCFDLDGGPLLGTFVAQLDGAPCTAERTGRVGSATYNVSSFDLTGDWDGTLAGSYSIRIAGLRNAELLLEGQREGRGLDATFSLDSLEATTTNYALATIAADITYTGFGNREWVVTFDGTADDLVGTATSENGTTCTISGPVDGLAVICT